jgi:hypothetical protein
MVSRIVAAGKRNLANFFGADFVECVTEGAPQNRAAN